MSDASVNKKSAIRLRRFLACALLVLGLVCIPESGFASPAPEPTPERLDEAWWTGPMLANTAASAPAGHGLVEVYFYDATAAYSNATGTFGYLLYGVTDKFSIGLNPTAEFNSISGTPGNSGGGTGDTVLLTQYSLSTFDPSGWLPTTAISLQETLPTGRYDRLGTRSGNGMGGGAYTTTLALYSQTYFWLPNGRILRARLDISRPLYSSRVHLEDASVYGTGDGFRGHAMLGSGVFIDTSWEYSLTQRWVLAMDFIFHHGDAARVSGAGPAPVRFNTGSSDTFGLAPAIEYSWGPQIGVLLGTRIIPASHNTTASVTPAVAINYVY